MLAYVQCQRAGIDAVEAGDAVLAKVVVKTFLAPPVAGSGQVAYHEPREEEAAAFDILGVHAVVADFGGGEDDELPGIRRVSQDLLVARHAGVEDDFA